MRINPSSTRSASDGLDLPAREAQELGRNWCLLGRINQKQVEAQPVGKNLRAHADFPWLGLEIA